MKFRILNEFANFGRRSSIIDVFFDQFSIWFYLCKNSRTATSEISIGPMCRRNVPLLTDTLFHAAAYAIERESCCPKTYAAPCKVT